MTNLDINTKLPASEAMSGFVRKNLVEPLPDELKGKISDNAAVTKLSASKIQEVEAEKRQEIASKQSLSDVVEEISREDLDETISQLNDSLQNIQRNLEFSIDKEVGRIVINVKDRETDELVRQIPSEEVLELARNLHAASERLAERTHSNSQSAAEGVFLRTSV